MNRKPLMKHLMHSVMAWLLAVSSIGILVSGFDLPVDTVTAFFLWCSVFAVGFSILFSLPHGWKIVIVIGLAVLVHCWNNETFMEQAETLLYWISGHYHQVCGWSVIGRPIAETVTLPLLLWAAVVAACVDRYFCFREGLYAVLVTVAAPLVLCMITLDTVPDTQYLFLLLLCFGLILITDWTGRHQDSRRVRLTLWLGMPVILFLIIVFSLNPKDQYVNHAEQIMEKLETAVDQLEEMSDSAQHTVISDAYTGQNLNLMNVGPKSNLAFTVMTVNSPRDGSLYLRGRDFDVYTGTQWQSSTDRKEPFSSGNITAGKLTVRTNKVRDVLYIPYYATDDILLKNGAKWNDGDVLEYTYFLSETPSLRTTPPDERYTTLTQETRRWAVPLVNRIVDGADSEQEIIFAIRDYVRDSAFYSRRTTRMDPAYDDFARWFLEASDRGYCVHFATSTTVLLRAAGIPARYVEGYLVNSVALKDVTVTNRDAHAWAEYYDTETGAWRVLEATPADMNGGGNEATENTTEPVTESTENTTEPDNEETEPSVTDPSDTQTDAPTEEPTETQPTETPETPGVHNKWISAAVLWLVGILCLPLQADLRIMWKRKLWSKGKPNEKAIARWRQTQMLSKVLKENFPDELDTLAQKAKFSQHTLDKHELYAFEIHRAALRNKLNERPWYQRLLIRLIFALE